MPKARPQRQRSRSKMPPIRREEEGREAARGLPAAERLLKPVQNA